MKKNALSPVTIILLMILVGLVIYIASHFETYEQTINTGWSREARYNPYLAAQNFLSKKDLKSTSSFRLASMEELRPRDALVVDRSLAIQSKKRIDELLHWVKNGGQLFVGADPSSVDETNDALLNRLNIEFYSVDYDCDDCESTNNDDEEDPEFVKKIKEKQQDAKESESEQDGESDFTDEDVEEIAEELVKLYSEAINQKTAAQLREEAEEDIDNSELTLVSFDNHQSENRLKFGNDSAIWHPDLYEDDPKSQGNGLIYWSGTDDLTHIIQFEIGSGLVTVFSDLHIWHNRKIANFDHANLLYEFTLNSERVHFLYGAEVPSIWERLRKHFPETIFSVLAFLILWLWSQTPQFGPKKAYQSVNRRSLSEHLVAASEFIWRSDNRLVLLDYARASVFQIAYQRIPGLKTLPQHAQIEKLAKQCRLPEEEIETLFFKRFDNIESADYKTLIQDLQKLRKTL